MKDSKLQSDSISRPTCSMINLCQQHHSPTWAPLNIQRCLILPSLKKVSESCCLKSKLTLLRTGSDNIPAYLLKEGAEGSPLTLHVLFVFQASLHQGKIPTAWKLATVSPTFKKGDRHNPGNYWPISLKSIICKIMEHILHSQIINHLDSHNLLTDKQFGFRKRHSCEFFC